MTQPLTDSEREKRSVRRRHKEAVLDAIATRKPSLVHIQHVLELIFSAFGGPEDYVAELIADYRASGEGSHVRARLHMLVDRMLQFCAQQYGKENPLANLTHDELIARFNTVAFGDGGRDDAA